MHPDRGYDRYGKHDAWNTPCNGFWQNDFDFTADPARHRAQHHRDKVNTWYTGMVIWNFATELWERVKITDRHEPSMARYRTMSYPLDWEEDEETEWRQHAKA